MSRIPRAELESLLIGYGYSPYFVELENNNDESHQTVHRQMAMTLDQVLADIKSIQHTARAQDKPTRPRWPMIVMITPKGWTGPKQVDGLPVEGTWRSHQVPFHDTATNPTHLNLLEIWLHSYRPGELFDQQGKPVDEIRKLIPPATKRIGISPYANGGLLLKDLHLP